MAHVVGGKAGWAVKGCDEIPRRILKYILKLPPEERRKAWELGTFFLGEWGMKFGDRVELLKTQRRGSTLFRKP